MNVDVSTIRLFLSSFFLHKTIELPNDLCLVCHLRAHKHIEIDFSDVNASRSLIVFSPQTQTAIPTNVCICVIIINWNNTKLQIAKSSESPCATKLQRFTDFFLRYRFNSLFFFHWNFLVFQLFSCWFVFFSVSLKQYWSECTNRM